MFMFQRVGSQTRAVGGKELKEDVENSQSQEEKPDATVKATCRAVRDGMLETSKKRGAC